MTMFKKHFYFNMLAYILLAALIFPGIGYSQPDALRVPIGDYTRLEDYITQTVLTEQVFPLSFLREIFSETGIKMEYRNKQGALESIDLSFPGINDGIVIRFVQRTEIELGNRPFTRTESDEKIRYTIAEDITFNETRYLLADMDSILGKYGNRLTLSNSFSLRLRQLAIYLAKNMDFGVLVDDNPDSLKREIESLYLLGLTLDSSNIIMPDKQINSLTFEEIKSQDSLYETDILDYMKANNLFTSLVSGKTNEFIENVRKIMVKEAIIAMRINFNFRIFSKGVEKLFSELKIPERKAEKRLFLKIRSKLKEYVKILQNEPIRGLLKDNLPIKDWKKRLEAAATPAEELRLVKEIVKIVDKYPANEDKERTIDFIIKYTLSAQEMSCLMRSILLSRILKEIGIGEDSLFTTYFSKHIFLIMKLKSEDYLEIQTTKNAFNHTRILTGEIVGKLNKAVKKAELLGSARLTLKEPLWGDLYSQSKVLTVCNNLEGLIESSYFNLSSSFKESQFTKEQKIKIYKMKSMLLQEATDIDPNDADAFNNLGNVLHDLAIIEKDTNSAEATNYLNEECAKYEKATTINPDYVGAFYSWSIALSSLAMIEKNTNPLKAINYLNEAIEKIEKVLRRAPQDRQAEMLLGIFREEERILKQFMLRDATRTAL